MDPFFISTASVAAGELGDKTQLLSLILATRLRKPVPIIAGIFVATLVNHLIACSIGEWAGSLITPNLLRWVLGISFLAVAVWALIPVAGTTLGMMIVNIPTVLFAERATKWIPVKFVRIVAALIYAILGVITLLGYSNVGL
jgi:putative Ca2+/H+ antiporter (TMEM165/GDT1 family)